MDLAGMVLAGATGTEAFDRAVDDADGADVAAVLLLADHEDPEVRRAVAATLPLLFHGDPPSDAAVDAAARLSADPDARVRDWACMALGTQWRETDTLELRDALAARLDDEHVDTRCEALVGLAYRHDPRALPAVRAALAREPDQVWLLELVAAGALSDTGLHPLVLRHLDGWPDRSAGTVDAVRRLTDPAGVGDDVARAVAEHCRRRARGLPVGDAVDGWQALQEVLEIAPHRAGELERAAAALLVDDPAALGELRDRSPLS